MHARLMARVQQRKNRQSMQTQSILLQPSSQYTDAAEESHNYHILGDQVLKSSLANSHSRKTHVGEARTVKAGVRGREAILVAIIAMDVESADSIHTLQLLEPVQRHLAGSGDELEQLGAFFFVERADSTPQPLDLR